MRAEARLFLACLMATLWLAPAARLTAQTFNTIDSFTYGSDGAYAYGQPYGVILSGNVLYGTTRKGGGGSNGTVFAVSAKS